MHIQAPEDIPALLVRPAEQDIEREKQAELEDLRRVRRILVEGLEHGMVQFRPDIDAQP